ncbi:putative carbohydrate-binding module family 18 protein [Botrytis fragariae]|uniref:Putative carbohydrate-binding module family 18 protein n=1 Tax=Botrytis fragariae TaxID=1964551 RepID=A0A8H6B3C4_9HELO|nr:putative carbohydrate-binding module family 18 protein [Botrytis fragariae]KAF5878708.1 putative carbohydrate-binding module family 18 protein [Botrytis fragariae]
MQFTNNLALGAILCASVINAHMSLTWPLPFRSALNPNAAQSQIDYSITAPLAASGANFPCKYNDMGTAGGKSVVTWSAGQTANWTVGTGAIHGGGSCQVALSYDSGKTFKVIHSYIGSCPTAVSSSAGFTVPADAPAGEAMFAWTWQNQVGNREFYMSCAAVTIESTKARAAPAVAFSARPDLFLVNLGNGCTSVEGKAVNYPNPGPDADVTRKTSDSGTFTGTCGPVNGVASSGSDASGSTSGSTGGESSSAPAVGAPSAPVPVASSSTTPVSIVILPTVAASSTLSSATIIATTAPASPTSSTTSPSSSGTSSGALQASINGLCSAGKTCTGSGFGPCCSKDGFCGIGDAWCGTGCQPGFGSCGTTLNSTSAANPIRKIRGRSWRL